MSLNEALFLIVKSLVYCAPCLFGSVLWTVPFKGYCYRQRKGYFQVEVCSDVILKGKS